MLKFTNQALFLKS